MKNVEIENKIMLLIEDLNNNELELKRIETANIPNKPRPPKICTIKEWNKYSRLLKEYHDAVELKTHYKKKIENSIRDIQKQIIEALPASNIWFIIKNYAIGHESNDWPMDNGHLGIIKDPIVDELPELKHRVTH